MHCKFIVYVLTYIKKVFIYIYKIVLQFVKITSKIFNIKIKFHIIFNIIFSIIEGSLEVKLPRQYGQMKSTGRVREEKRRRKRKSQKKEDPGARKGRKVAKHCVFPVICGSGGSKGGLAKAAGAEPAGQMRDEKVARRCGAKHISKSKCTKHLSSENF